MKTKNYTRLQKLLPILSNLTAFLAQYSVSPILEIVRLGAMTALNAVNLAQSIKQKNVLNTVWNSVFLGLDSIVGLSLGRQGMIRSRLLSKENDLFEKTARVRSSLQEAEYGDHNYLKPQDELNKLSSPLQRPTRWQRLGDPTNEIHLQKEQEVLDNTRRILTKQTEGLKRDIHNIQIFQTRNIPVTEYEPEQLNPDILRDKINLSPKSQNALGLVNARYNKFSNYLKEDQTELESLQKAQSNMNAQRRTRRLNRANNLLTNVKDYAVLESKTDTDPKPPKQQTWTNVGLQSGEAFIGGL